MPRDTRDGAAATGLWLVAATIVGGVLGGLVGSRFWTLLDLTFTRVQRAHDELQTLPFATVGKLWEWALQWRVPAHSLGWGLLLPVFAMLGWWIGREAGPRRSVRVAVAVLALFVVRTLDEVPNWPALVFTGDGTMISGFGYFILLVGSLVECAVAVLMVAACALGLRTFTARWLEARS